jgi:hypothetical protein
MMKPSLKYRVLNIVEKRKPLSLNCTQHAIRAEFETAFDAYMAYRNILGRVPNGEALLSAHSNTVEVLLSEER